MLHQELIGKKSKRHKTNAKAINFGLLWKETKLKKPKTLKGNPWKIYGRQQSYVHTCIKEKQKSLT